MFDPLPLWAAGFSQKGVSGGPMQTGMYAISEMASLFNVSRQTLIYYDKIGLFKPAVVNEKGYRFYSPHSDPAHASDLHAAPDGTGTR